MNSYAKMVTDLAQLLAEALPETPLALQPTAQPHPHFSAELLGGFPSTAKISLMHIGWDVRSVLQYLVQRRTNELSGEDEWPCPNLKELDLRGVAGIPVGDIRSAVKGRWVKMRAPAKSKEAEAVEVKETKPEGSIEVTVPIGRSGKTETWRPVQTTQNGKRPSRRKAQVVYDDGEEAD